MFDYFDHATAREMHTGTFYVVCASQVDVVV